MTRASRPLILAPDEDGIASVVEHLLAGGLVALPTETVYGLAARADRDDSVAAIYAAKGRPSFNPLIVHVSDVEDARRLAVFDNRAERLAEALWPGSLTMVLPVRADAGLAAAATAGLSTVALRCPSHPVMRQVLEKSGLALAAPSANHSGGVSPTSPEHVARSLGNRVEMILDGGACAAGVESTIVALRDDGTWQVLRPGPVTANKLADLLDVSETTQTSARIEAPGQLASHYAPGKPMRLDAQKGEADEFLIGFRAITGHVQLSASGDLAEAATNLYAALHQATLSSLPRIAVAPIPSEGLGLAINDRLRRAAA